MIWYETKEFRDLYQLCRLLRAPEFQSPEQMVDWLSRHFQAQKHYWIQVSSLQTVIEVLREVDLPIFEKLEMLLWEIVREFVQKPSVKFLFKAIFTPLEMYPKTLHPIDSVA